MNALMLDARFGHATESSLPDSGSVAAAMTAHHGSPIPAISFVNTDTDLRVSPYAYFHLLKDHFAQGEPPFVMSYWRLEARGFSLDPAFYFLSLSLSLGHYSLCVSSCGLGKRKTNALLAHLHQLCMSFAVGSSCRTMSLIVLQAAP